MLSTINSSYSVENPYKKANKPATMQKNNALVTFRANDTLKTAENEGGEKFKPVRSFAKGLITPIEEVLQAIIEKPAQTALLVGLTAAVVKCIKPVRLVLSGLIAGYGSYKVGSGLYNARKELKEGNNAGANKQVERFGEGLFDVGLSSISLSRSVAAIKQTNDAVKAATEGGKTLTNAQKVYTALTWPADKEAVTKLGQGKNVQDALKLVGTEGWQAIKDFKNGVQRNVSGGVKTFADKIKSGQLKQDILGVTGKIKNFFKDIDYKNLSKITVYTERVEDLLNETMDTLNQDALDVVTFIDSVREEPDSLVAIKELRRRGKLDQVAEAVTKTIGDNQYQEVRVEDKIKPVRKKD